MTKKTQTPVHQIVVAAFVAAVATSVVTMGMMSFAESDGIIAYSNTSANPYQPVIVPTRDTTTIDPSMSSSASRASKSKLTRKIKQLERTIASVHKRLQNAEDKIPVLERMVETVQYNQQASMQKSLDELRAKRDMLSDQFASLQTQLVELQTELKYAR